MQARSSVFSRRTLSRAFALLLVAATFTLVPPVAQAHHGVPPDNNTWASLFTIFCDPSHTNNDDPITGADGTSHLHQYFGSPQFQVPMPSEATIENGSTTCRHEADTTGYWVPALLNSSGAVQTPAAGSTYFYYYCQPVGATCVTDQPIPNGLKVIWGTTVGDPLNNQGGGGAFSPTGGWRCAVGGFTNRIRDCANGLHLELIPPSCWDGVNLDSANHRSHMAYDNAGVCPPSHPVKLALPNYFINFPNLTQAATQGYRLSSDPATCDDPVGTANDTCGQTAHADFWNTWDQAKLEQIATDCTITHIDVGESINDQGCRLLESTAWFADTTTPDDGNLTNGNFETGNLSGWTVTGNIAANTASKNTGTYGAQLNAVAGSGTNLKQVLPVTEGETLCVSANIYPQTNYAAGQARASIQQLGTGFPFTAITPQLAGSNGGGAGPGEFKHVWAQGVVSDTEPTDTTSVQVLFSVQPEADGVGTVRFDDLSFYHGPCDEPGGGGGNVAPTVSAGSNQTITLPASANLDGTVSDDGLPNPPGSVTTTWSKVSGPGTVTFGNANVVDTTASFSVDGTYVLRLTGDDSDLTTTDDVQITVNPAPSGANLDQVHFRGRNDDGSETSATWKAAVDTGWTQAVDTNFRVRFTVDAATGFDAPSADYRYQYRLNGGTWTDVTATSLVVRAFLSPNITNGGATTQQLTPPTGAFRAGLIDENNGAFGIVDLASGEFTEFEGSMQIRSADVVNGDTVELRVSRNTLGVLDAYTQIASITVSE